MSHENTEFGPATHAQVFAFLWRYLRGRTWYLAGLIILLLVFTVIGLIQPFFYKEAIDAIAMSTEPTKERALFAFSMVVWGVLFGAAFLTLEALGSAMLGWLEARVMREVWVDVFERIQRYATRFHVNMFAGSTSRKIGRGVDAVENMLDIIWFSFLPLVASVIGFTVVLLFYAPIIAVVIILCMIVYVPASIWLNLKVARRQLAADELDSHATANMVDAFTGNAAVKSFGRERDELARHRENCDTWMQAVWRQWQYGNIVGWLQSSAMMVIELLLLSLAVYLWYRGDFTAGGFIVISFYVGRLWGYMHDIGKSTRNYLKAVSHSQEMVGLYRIPLGVEDATNAKSLAVPRGAIDFRAVTFTYEKSVPPVFADFSVTIEAGTKIALVGHSGGGKSTFAKLLQRLYDVQSGGIFIDEQNIGEVTQESLRKAIGLVPQDPVLFHRSLRENISYGKPDATEEEIIAAAKKAHAHEFICKFPQGYDTLVGERGIKLSGGERQRVAIARAFLADCPILILDEATSSLDSISEGYIQEALGALMESRTSIVIAHRLSTIKHADRILVIEQGKIVEEGNHASLIQKKDGIYRGFYELQAGGFIGE